MMHNPNTAKLHVRTYTLKNKDGETILETTDPYEVDNYIEGYTALPSSGFARANQYEEWKASTDRIELISTCNYALMGGFITQYYK